MFRSTYLDDGDACHECQVCGAEMWFAERLKGVKKNEMPQFGICCCNGKIIVPLLRRPTKELEELFFNKHSMQISDMTKIKYISFSQIDLQISFTNKEAAALSQIQKLLLRNGRSLDDYPSLPRPDEDNIIDISNQLILQELNYDKKKERVES
ncbi:hypothetical protein K1719_027938 [Acacia pycnantha]|nr:hypothetical protein K1719_027938 [Acacia pycnantha]